MNLYRRKPTEVQAIQFNSYDNIKEIKEFCKTEYVEKDTAFDSQLEGEIPILIFGELGYEIYPGSWIVYEDDIFRIYDNEDFKFHFELIN